ncbi:DEAD/DEAH box helicase [Micromonospora sp. KC606]|uniref:EcoAI/FtnUII family type I restriction enzme subunit R n=1 Tax=Micromonospora sp. KC606 TaxID=2530379 RepID=UPI001047F4F4|nr:DEAD/DEAH box helicase family protein [Micromonospora sp. KC606]TDC79258.1 DEAD/DEAH box helicase [Micromonospora sp. KC606]
MDKRNFNERDICTKFITPALRRTGWDELTQIREEVRFTKGRVLLHGKVVSRGQGKRADYILYYQPDLPLAVIEAKDNNHSLTDGMQQALEYATTLGIPFAFSSNGDGFAFHDLTGASDPTEVNLALDDFPSPEGLWARYRAWKGILPEHEETVLQKYFEDPTGKAPRYYQVAAVNAAIEAIAKGGQRLLLVMATGTGKTYTAFQIIWRLWRSGQKKRVLFLADRNILIDQTMVNDFRPFGPAMAKLSTRAKTIERAERGTGARRIDTAYEIYLSLYQAITGPDERQKLYREFSPNFFDLIVVDECHRGSAAEDSAWREILEYFSGATQLGLTATPKETEYVSNVEYFGSPVYTYSLRQGISDGFLAPYRVIKVGISVDVDGYKPPSNTLDRYGRKVEDRTYTSEDFDSNIVIDERTKLVARKVSDFLKDSGDRFQKTIVFCVDQEHAARMRQALVNENQDLCRENHRYVMRITGSDIEGNTHLGNFMDPESRYPVIVTTSRLLSTGVDVQTCRVIAIDRPITSMTEFKQILGRGTRIHEDTGKFYFTVIDFRKATDHFADPEFDGEPVQIYQPETDQSLVPPDETKSKSSGVDDQSTPVPSDQILDKKSLSKRKLYLDGIELSIVEHRVEYLDHQGVIVSDDLKLFTQKLLLDRFGTVEEFRRQWNSTPKKSILMTSLGEAQTFLHALVEQGGTSTDPYDVICHVAFGQPVLSREQRASRVRATEVLSEYSDPARAVLEALLQKYEDEGTLDLDDLRLLQIAPFDSMGTPLQLVRRFQSRDGFERAVRGMQRALYQEEL